MRKRTTDGRRWQGIAILTLTPAGWTLQETGKWVGLAGESFQTLVWDGRTLHVQTPFGLHVYQPATTGAKTSWVGEYHCGADFYTMRGPCPNLADLARFSLQWRVCGSKTWGVVARYSILS